ncbi:MAG TPA: class I SAM-dependent methyltransferase [Alphaproteobacteria bacterium]|nr:class I SAM-dependent methyltransferase [Alphaproteobacteria bacterium]USO06544.1 MAG: class I SAM-dependent methyltransferase [Rhodospirillales bacterium]HOO81961.1 class I SAM-dependent methyltransferase [Alphaproteobacteria bacterium]
MSEEADTKDEMNRMYRWTRHVYDASRKYFLLGRDQLINTLRLKDGEHVCEVGCGTARNLIKMARRYPKTHFYGLDASDEMLKTARGSLKFSGLSERVHVKQSFAQNFDPQELFNLSAPLDKILFSYALSIIPPWQDSIDHAVQLLATGGEIHIVDFGDMKDQPAWFKKIIFWWISLFHVYHKPEILEHLQDLVRNGQGTLNITHLYNGYAYLAVFKKT